MKWPFVLRSTYTELETQLQEKENVIQGLLSEQAKYYREANERNLQNLNLAGAIRNIDQIIYQMGQCMSWEQMRPYFNELQHSAEQRQKAESDLIGQIIINRLSKEVRNG